MRGSVQIVLFLRVGVAFTLAILTACAIASDSAVENADYTCVGSIDMHYSESDPVRIVCKNPAFSLNCDRVRTGLVGKTVRCETVGAEVATSALVSTQGFQVYDESEEKVSQQVHSWTSGVTDFIAEIMKIFQEE